jgi:hypothetical protein
MTDVVAQRSATCMPPTSLALSFPDPTDAEKTAETTATRHEEKPKPFTIGRDHVREGSLQKPFQQGNLQFNPKIGDKSEKQQFPLQQRTVKPFWEDPKPPPKRWNKAVLKKLPRHFPLERTNRSIKLEECTFEELHSRLADSFRVMSIQAKFFDKLVRVCCLSTDDRL